MALVLHARTLVLAIRPAAKFRARGTTVLDYGEAAQLALDAGTSHITVSSEPARSPRVIAALRSVKGSQRVNRALSAHEPRDARARDGAVEGSERVARRLPPPRYPRAYVEELRRVRDAYVRLGNVRAVRTKLGISKRAVRF